MNKLKEPKHKGLKIYCKKCKLDNPLCKHYESHQYRVRLHISGTTKGVKTKVFKTRDYGDAVKQAIDFEKEMIANNFQRNHFSEIGNDFSLVDAIVRYNQYLGGNHPLAQKKKIVTPKHQWEYIRFCTMFAEVVKKRTDVSKLRVVDVSKYDVSNFYEFLEKKYSPKYFNKGMGALKAFFKFLIEDEEIVMRNPFNSYESKSLPRQNIMTITNEEFQLILQAVDTSTPLEQINDKVIKNRYKPYLKDAFKLFLFTGLRRDNVLNIRWSDIYTINEENIESHYLYLPNLKMDRITGKDTEPIYIPFYPEFQTTLDELGFANKKGSDDFILCPNRTESISTMREAITKAFTHYKKMSGIKRPITLKHLRKTYLTYSSLVYNMDTGKMSSQTEATLKNHYIDHHKISLIKKGAREMKIFA